MNKEQKKNFIRAYEEHFRNLLRLCYLYVSDKEMAMDIVQDTFAKVWKYIFLGGVVKNMKAFLYKILKNNIINYYRTKKTISLDSLIEDEHFDIKDRNVEVSMEEHADAILAFKHLDDISKRDKKIVSMHFVKGLKFKNIANITKQPVNTVVVQFHRAIKKLRNLYYHHQTQY